MNTRLFTIALVPFFFSWSLNFPDKTGPAEKLLNTVEEGRLKGWAFIQVHVGPLCPAAAPKYDNARVNRKRSGFAKMTNYDKWGHSIGMKEGKSPLMHRVVCVPPTTEQGNGQKDADWKESGGFACREDEKEGRGMKGQTVRHICDPPLPSKHRESDPFISAAADLTGRSNIGSMLSKGKNGPPKRRRHHPWWKQRTFFGLFFTPHPRPPNPRPSLLRCCN